MPSNDRVDALAQRILEMGPDPVPRYRILRDILKLPPEHPELVQAKRHAMASRWTVALNDEQLEDGSWGRFHSADSTRRVRFGTTEIAVARCIELGIDEDAVFVRRARTYMGKLLTGHAPFPDPPERNDRWPVGVQMFVAATLAELDPQHAELETIYHLWLQVTSRTFRHGTFDADLEWQAHCDLTGARSMRGSFLNLNNRYALSLLTRSQGDLPDHLESALTSWLWAGKGLQYFGVEPSLMPSQLDHRNAEGWLKLHQLLSRLRSWPAIAGHVTDALWQTRRDDGLWDFGPTSGLRLSENWRKPMSRAIDHSIYVLALVLAMQ